MGSFFLSILMGIVAGVIVAAYYRAKDEARAKNEGVKEELYLWYQYLSNVRMGLLE